MPETLEPDARQLLEDANFCYIATVGKDGRPQVNPIWVDLEGDAVLVNSEDGRSWPNNLRRDPQVTLCVPEKDNPYHYVTIWGRVAEDTQEGAFEHIDKLAKKYLGKDEYPNNEPGDVRVIFRIEVEKVKVYGESARARTGVNRATELSEGVTDETVGDPESLSSS
jgi:PPOX class probable F420-dependent enzyme